MPDSKRFLHPEAISRIARLELRARHIVEGFLSGHAPQPVLRAVGRVPAASRIHAPATTCGTSTGKSGPSRTATTSSSSRKRRTCAARCWSTFRSSMQYGTRPAEQVRVRLHDRRQPGLSAAAAAGCGRLRVVRRRDARHGAAAHQAQPFAIDHSGARRSASRAKRPTCSASCATWPKAIRAAA